MKWSSASFGKLMDFPRSEGFPFPPVSPPLRFSSFIPLRSALPSKWRQATSPESSLAPCRANQRINLFSFSDTPFPPIPPQNRNHPSKQKQRKLFFPRALHAFSLPTEPLSPTSSSAPPISLLRFSLPFLSLLPTGCFRKELGPGPQALQFLPSRIPPDKLFFVPSNSSGCQQVLQPYYIRSSPPPPPPPISTRFRGTCLSDWRPP